MIREVAVSEILRRVVDSYDNYPLHTVEGWQEMIATKGGDRQIPSIIRAIQEHGFLDPICIEEFPTSGEWCLGNGHHRLVVAILLGLDSIPVDFSSWYSNASTANLGNLNRFPEDIELAKWISATIIPLDSLASA